MKCPFGSPDHQATWRCYAVYALDWVLGVIPDDWPLWMSKPFMALMCRIEMRGGEVVETTTGGSDGNEGT